MAWCAAHLCLADTPGLADVSQVDSDPLTEEVRLLSPLLTPQDRDIVRGMVRRLAEGRGTD